MDRSLSKFLAFMLLLLTIPANGQRTPEDTVLLHIRSKDYRVFFSCFFQSQYSWYSMILNPIDRIPGSSSDDWETKQVNESGEKDEPISIPEPFVFSDRPMMDEARIIKCVEKSFTDLEIKLMREARATLRLFAIIDDAGRVPRVGICELLSHSDIVFTVSPRSLEKAGRLVARYISFPRAAEVFPRMGLKYYEQYYPLVIQFNENGEQVNQ